MIVAAVAVVKSACNPVLLPNLRFSLAPVRLPFKSKAPLLFSPNKLRLEKVPAVAEKLTVVPSLVTGAVLPKGKVTASPFCGHGKALVK